GGDDYDSTTIQVTFAAGDNTAQVILVPTSDDSTVEASENLTASLALDPSTPLTGYSKDTSDTGTGTINDNDTATYTISNATVTEGGNLAFTVSLSNPVDVETKINVTFTDGSATGGGDDYDSTTIQVTFAAGDKTAQGILVPTSDDSTVEASENLTASLALDPSTPLTGYSKDTSDTGTGTINDNDTATYTISNA